MGDWLTVIIVLLIVGILLDGWRRMRNAHKDSLKVSRSMRKSAGVGASSGADSYSSAELPNGGARVVGYRESQDPTPRFTPTRNVAEDELLDGDDTDELEPDDDLYEEDLDGEDLDDSELPGSGGDPEAEDEDELPPEPAPQPAHPKGRIPQQVALNLDESVPILMETETTENDDHDPSGRIEPTLGGSRSSSGNNRPKTSVQRHVEKAKPEKSRAEKPRPEKVAPSREPAPVPPEPEEVLVVNIMAPAGQQFRGDALLEALLQANLRYGDMNIFHRYQESRGGGPILFSLANMVKPGIFDLDTMNEFSTPGVSLFMTLPLEGARLENVDVFELMLDTARSIADDLGGELKDENRSVMTRQTMEHCRQRIHEFERKQLSRTPG